MMKIMHQWPENSVSCVSFNTNEVYLLTRIETVCLCEYNACTTGNIVVMLIDRLVVGRLIDFQLMARRMNR